MLFYQDVLTRQCPTQPQPTNFCEYTKNYKLPNLQKHRNQFLVIPVNSKRTKTSTKLHALKQEARSLIQVHGKFFFIKF